MSRIDVKYRWTMRRGADAAAFTVLVAGVVHQATGYAYWSAGRQVNRQMFTYLTLWQPYHGRHLLFKGR
jgi:thiamine transporter ThiT